MNNFKNHIFRETKKDFIMTRFRGYTKRELIYRGNDGQPPRVIWPKRYDYIIIKELGTNKFIAKMDTKKARKIYGIVPEKRKKIRLHLSTFGEYTDYIDNYKIHDDA